jgi:hypothetical protein
MKSIQAGWENQSDKFAPGLYRKKVASTVYHTHSAQFDRH